MTGCSEKKNTQLLTLTDEELSQLLSNPAAGRKQRALKIKGPLRTLFNSDSTAIAADNCFRSTDRTKEDRITCQTSPFVLS